MMAPAQADSIHERPADHMVFAARSGSALRGRLWTIDPSLMDYATAAELLVEMPRLIAYAEALQATAVECVREGIANEPLSVRDGQPERLDGNVAHGLAVTEVATIQETSEGAAARRVNTSEALCTIHLGVLEALEAGDIHFHHAQTIVEQAATLPEEAREWFGLLALEKARTKTGRLRTPPEFRRAVRDLREKLHPESIATRKREAAAERGVWCRPEQDGMLTLTALMPAVTGLALYKRVDELARAAHRGPDEHRTLPQLRHDVLAHLSLTGDLKPMDKDPLEAPPRAVPTSGLPEPVRIPDDFAAHTKGRVVVHIATQALTGIKPPNALAGPNSTPQPRSRDTAYLDGYGVIDAETARRLAAAASVWERLWTDADGTPLRLGRTAYRPSAAQRRFLEYRDGTCTFPGCLIAAGCAELDHTHEWQDGGGTNADNLAHLCRKHHALKSLALVHARQEAAAVARDAGTEYSEPTGAMVFATMLGYERTTTPADRDRLLGLIDDPPPPDDSPPPDHSPPHVDRRDKAAATTPTQPQAPPF